MLAILALKIWKKEDEKFRNILDYLASLRPAAEIGSQPRHDDSRATIVVSRLIHIEYGHEQGG